MVASSPAKINSGATAAAASAATPSSFNASKSQRGLNKPKCIKCGNVARSRCPFESCKNCCVIAENHCPKHVNVSKGNSSFPDRPPSSSSPLFDQQSTEVSHSGNFHRLRQLSSKFTQFSNLQTPFRSRKPLTKKDAQVINEWRFLKLKEFKDQKIEAETEAFDRYVQNVGLLEEVFLVNSGSDEQSCVVNSSSDGENSERIVQGLKLKLGSNPVRTDNFRKRIQHIVDQGKAELVVDGTSDLSDTEGRGLTANKKIKSLSDLNDKLNKARNEDDLKACQEMASEMFRWNNTKTKSLLGEAGEFLLLLSSTTQMDDSKSDSFTTQQQQSYNNNLSTLDHEALCRINAQFSEIEDL